MIDSYPTIYKGFALLTTVPADSLSQVVKNEDGKNFRYYFDSTLQLGIIEDIEKGVAYSLSLYGSNIPGYEERERARTEIMYNLMEQGYLKKVG